MDWKGDGGGMRVAVRLREGGFGGGHCVFA